MIFTSSVNVCFTCWILPWQFIPSSDFLIFDCILIFSSTVGVSVLWKCPCRVLNLSLLVSTVFTGSKPVLKLPFCFSVHSTAVLLWIIPHSCAWCTWGFWFLISDLFTRHSPRRTANFLLPSKKTDQVFLVLISGTDRYSWLLPLGS